MGERRGTRALELWCKKMTEGYPGVKVDNMTTSWRDGLAFCAVIHHFRPELIDFSKLNKDDIYSNNELAFSVAEQYLGIPALLDPADMVEYPVPDRLSILTYMSLFHKAFTVPHGSSPSRTVPKRPATATERGIVSPASTSPPTKMAVRSGGVNVGLARREPCAKCGLPVFIAERLNVGKQLYHRTCFRCARCNSQLTLQNYYETETENQYCCETCPDEEKSKMVSPAETAQPPPETRITRSLSDEEKSAGLKDRDEYSCMFETALDLSEIKSSEDSEYSKARSHFFSALLGSSGNEDLPPDLPKSKRPAMSTNIDTEIPPDLPKSKRPAMNISNIISPIVNADNESANSEQLKTLEPSVNNHSFSDVSINQQKTASQAKLDKNTDVVTKENVQGNTSLVQARMRLFQPAVPSTRQSKKPEARREENKKDVVLNRSRLLSDNSVISDNSKCNDSEKHGNSVITISDDSLLQRNEVISISDDVISISDDSILQENHPEKIKENISKPSQENRSLPVQKQTRIGSNSSDSIFKKDKSPSKVFKESKSVSNSGVLYNVSTNLDISISNDSLSKKDSLCKSSESILENDENIIKPVVKKDNEKMEDISQEESMKSLEKQHAGNKDLFLNEQEISKDPEENKDPLQRKHEESEGDLQNEDFTQKENEKSEDDVEKEHEESEDLLRKQNEEFRDDEGKNGESGVVTTHDESLIQKEANSGTKDEPVSFPEEKLRSESGVDVSESRKDVKSSDEEKNTEVLEEQKLKSESPVEELVEDGKLKESDAEVKYPEDLNPFGDDEEPSSIYEKSLNPFSDDEDDEDGDTVALKKIYPNPKDYDLQGSSGGDTSESFLKMKTSVSMNPFEDDEDEVEEEKVIKPAPRLKKLIAPKISLTPIFRDDCKEKADLGISVVNPPEPRPRTSITSGVSSGTFGSSSSISSGTSSVSRKKKAAPRPPIPTFQNSPQESLNSSPSGSVQHSPRLRKNRKAPQPPTSTPCPQKEVDCKIDCSPIPINNSTLKNGSQKTSHNLADALSVTILSPTNSIESGEYEKEKVAKDEVNRNRQSQTSQIQSPDKSLQIPSRDKSTYGKWKRKKGQAPSRPIPQKRTIKALPMAEVRRELDLIEVQQQGLEKQGVRLEEIIRERCEGPNADPDSAVSIEVEDLILQLFEVVNEKNELCRRQAELMYLQRQQRLEEEYAEVEYQIRCLMHQPDANKTDSDKEREESLISRLVEIVERRNEIIECLEMDRVREAEEDDSICSSMNSYASKRDECSTPESVSSPKKKDKKKFKKKFKLKMSSHKVDMDKDVDESESADSSIVVVKEKEKKKKKFNLF